MKVKSLSRVRLLPTPWTAAYLPGSSIHGIFQARVPEWGAIAIENPKDSIRKLVELISEFSKVAGYKINTQKSLAFLYTNNEKLEREIKESIPFTIAINRIKYLGINSHTENYKTLMKQIKDDINRKIFHVPGLEESIL